jgi:hypothetical protein
VPGVSALLSPLDAIVAQAGIDLDKIHIQAVRIDARGTPVTYPATVKQALAVSVSECLSLSDGTEWAGHPLYPAAMSACAIGVGVYQAIRAREATPPSAPATAAPQAPPAARVPAPTVH